MTRPSPITLCPRPCDRCRAADRERSRRWAPCAHQAGHGPGDHECSEHRLEAATPATVAAAHALDDVRAAGPLRLAP